MHIAIDARPLAIPRGGIRRYTECLIRALSRVDAENRYALCGAPRNADRGLAALERELDPARFQLHREPFPRARTLEHLWLVSAPGDVDLYHGTNYGAPWFFARPTVITVHDATVQKFPAVHPLRRRLRHRLVPAQCRRAARVIADSAATRDDVVEWFGVAASRIAVVPLAATDGMRPVTDGAALRELRERLRVPERFLLYAGALEPRKDLVSLFEALARLRAEGRKEALVLAGDGERAHRALLDAALARLGLEPGRDVHWLGAVSDADLAALYSACVLFVYPSLYEGFGLPPIEAMACGAPVVATRTSALAENFADAAALVAPHDPTALASALARWLDDATARAELAANGTRRARARNWDDVARETIAVYRDAVRGSSWTH
jgi:glycosyltransferase involved in cell wall biosynthesis